MPNLLSRFEQVLLHLIYAQEKPLQRNGPHFVRARIRQQAPVEAPTREIGRTQRLP